MTVVHNLASDLSYALDDWMDDISHPDCKRQLWMAHVYPASYHEFAVSFENIRARRVETPLDRLERARRELVTATKLAFPHVGEWRVARLDDESPDKPCMVGAFLICAKG